MTKTSYQQVTQERYEILYSRYQKYLDTLNDPNSEPIRVFDPLGKKLIDEIELIREVSRELQAKKEEDMKKAAAAQQAAEEEAKKRAEEEKAKEESEEKSEEK